MYTTTPSRIPLKTVLNSHKRSLWASLWLCFFAWGCSGSEPSGPNDAGQADAFSTAVEIQQIESKRVDNANIWSGLSYDGSRILFTTVWHAQGAAQKHIHLRHYDSELTELTKPLALTRDADVPVGKTIADHKQIFQNGSLYLSWSTAGDKELYLLRFDAEGKRSGEQVAVVEGSQFPTNDMHLVSDSKALYVVYGPAGYDKEVAAYDLDLASSYQKTITAGFRFSSLGSTTFVDGTFHLFSGDERQRSVIASHWDQTWTLKEPGHHVVVPTDNDDWNWFSSSAVYDPKRKLWYVAYNHMLPPEEADLDSTIRLAVVGDDFSHLAWQHIAGPAAFRPQLLLVDDTLYLSYDGSGVYLQRYAVKDL
jgi:hypothetical protein